MKKRRFLAILLTLAMAFSMMPITTFAAVADTDVAKIGDTGYSKLSDAIKAAQDGDTIVLLKDFSDGGNTIGKNLTLDLNGKTMTISSGDAFKVSSGYSFTLSDSNGDGKIVAHDGRGIMWVKGGNATITGGTYDTNPGGGFVSITNNGSLSITGGTFDIDPSNYDSDWDESAENYVSDGYEAVANGTTPETWTVKAKQDDEDTPADYVSTLYVDDNWSEGNVPEGRTWGVDAFATIQTAVDKVDATKGVTTINVAEGQYDGNVALNQSNLKFTVDNVDWYGNVAFVAEKDATITLTGYFTFGNDSVNNIANLTVSGFTCTNDNYLVYLMNSGGTSKNVVVKDNTLTDGQIYINSGVVENVQVSDNNVTEKDVNYCLSLGGTSSIIKNTAVSNNTFNGHLVGIFGMFADEGIQMTNNTFNLTWYLWINNGKAVNTGKMTLSGNKFDTENPIFAFGTKYTVKSDFVIGEGNTCKDAAFDGWGEYLPSAEISGIDPAHDSACYYEGKLYLGDEPAATNYVAKIGENKYETLADAVAAAKEGDDIEILKADTYTLPNLPNNITVTGNVDGVVFNCEGSGSIASIPNGATFENVSMNFGQSSYHGFQHAGTINMNNCVLNGLFFSYGDMNFTGCTFNQTNAEYMMWLYSGDISFDGCTFNGNGKFFNVYNEGNGAWNVSVKDCIAISSTSNKAVFNVKETCGSTNLAYNVSLDGTNVAVGAFPTAKEDGALKVLNGFVQVDDRREGGTDEGGNITIKSENDAKLAVLTVDEYNEVKDNPTQLATKITEKATAMDAGYETPAKQSYVAKIGEIEYTSLKDAFAAAPDNTETKVVVIADIVYDTFDQGSYKSASVVVPTAKNIVLDLNGHTISAVSDDAGATEIIYNMGTLKITDSGTNGKITYESNHPDGGYGYGTNTILNRGNLTVAGGTIENTTVGGASYAVDSQTLWYDEMIPVVFNLTGGTVKCTTGDAAIRQSAGCYETYKLNGQIIENNMVISDGTVDGDIWIQCLTNNSVSPASPSHSNLQITGGTITGKVYDTVTNDFSHQVISITGGYIGNAYSRNTGYAGFITGGYFKNDVSASVAEGYECVKIADKTDKTDADNAAIEAGYTYTIGEAKAPVAQIGNTKYETLQSAFDAAIAGDTVKLLADVDVTEQLLVNDGKNFNLDLAGFTIEYKGETTLTSGVIGIKHGGALTIKDSSTGKTGAIKSGNNAYAAVAMTIKGDTADTKPAVLTVKGGTLEGKYYGITGNGSTGRGNTKVFIQGGTVKGTMTNDSTGIYNPQSGTLVISGGTVEGATGVYVKAGNPVTVSGGTIKGTGAKGEYQTKGDGFDSTGDGFVVDNCGYPGGAPVPSITGGTFISENNQPVASYASGYTGLAPNEPVVGFVSGGKFKGAVNNDNSLSCNTTWGDVDENGYYTVGIIITHTHSFGIWQSDNESTHSRICDCGETEVGAHEFGAPTVSWTFPANGKVTATYSTTCAVCGKQIIKYATALMIEDSDTKVVWSATATIGGKPCTATKEVEKNYTVTVPSGFTGGGSYAYGTTVKVALENENLGNYYDFSLNGAPAAFNVTSLTFKVTGDVTVGATQYVKPEEPKEVKPVLTMTVDLSSTSINADSTGKYKVPFKISWAIEKDSGIEVVEVGYIYRYGGKDFAEIDTDTVLAKGSVKTSTLKSLNGSYKCTHGFSSSYAGRYIYAVGYMIYKKGGQTYTIYTDEIGTNNANCCATLNK